MEITHGIGSISVKPETTSHIIMPSTPPIDAECPLIFHQREITRHNIDMANAEAKNIIIHHGALIRHTYSAAAM